MSEPREIPERLRNRIDGAFQRGMSRNAFREALSALFREMLTLDRQRYSNSVLQQAFVYFEYVMANVLLSSRPEDAQRQLEYGIELREKISSLSIQGSYSAGFRLELLPHSTPDEIGSHERFLLHMLRSMYNVNTAFYRNAQRNGQDISPEETERTLVSLNEVVGTYLAPPLTRFEYSSGQRQTFLRGWYANTRLLEEDDATRLQLGVETLSSSVLQEWDFITWDLDGAQDDPDRWAYISRLMTSAVPEHPPRVLAVQNQDRLFDGDPVVHIYYPVDQFGLQHTVNERRHTHEGQEYSVFTYAGLDTGYRLAFVMPVHTRDTYFAGIQLVADGYDPTAEQSRSHHHALGLRLATNWRDRNAGSVIYTFAASSTASAAEISGNTERIARTVAWHTNHPYALLGDFRRDPNDPTQLNWLPSPESGEIRQPDGPTFPAVAPLLTYDYAIFAAGLPVIQGIVQAVLGALARHRAVMYPSCRFPR